MKETIEKEITRGGAFVVKDTLCENIFTPEDFTEEQKMMRDAVKEFADKEIWSKKEEFEKKNFQLTLDVMKKAGELGFLGIGIPEAYWYVITYQVVQAQHQLLLELILELALCLYYCMEMKIKRLSIFQNLLVVNILELTV
jgi:alkylation response protein AidB-like acyl-CoA dehydrogenase